MLDIFRSNTIFSIAGLVLFAILIRLASFFVAVPVEPIYNTPFSSLIFAWLKENQLFLNQNAILATIVVFLQALLVNYISSEHEIIYKGSLLPGLFYILLNSIYIEQLQLTPQLIANTFIILLLNRLCYLYESQRPLLLVFDAGILLGLGLLFDYDLIIYLPFILISVLYMTAFNLRYWLVAIFGILLPLYFLGVGFFVFDHLKEFIVSIENTFKKSYFNPIGITIFEGAIWLIIIPVFFFSAIEFQLNFLRNKVKTRRIQLIILVMLMFGVVSIFAENQGYVFGLNFISVTLSMVMANYFIRSKRKVFKDILFFAMITCICYYQYFNH